MQEQFTEAVRRLQRGRPQEALSILAPLARQQADHPEVLHLLGVLQYETGNPEAGHASLTRAAALAPANPEIPYNHASALLRAGDVAAALELFDRCLAVQPNHASAWQNRGAALRELGRGDEAAQSYRRAVALEPGRPGALYNLGTLALEAGDPDQAVGWFERCVAHDPAHVGAWTGLGVARSGMGQLPAALRALRQAVAAGPQDARAWQELGRVQVRALDYEAGIASFSRAAELAPDDADIANDLGSALTGVSRLAEAERSLRRALVLAPGHREAYVNLVSLLELANRLAEARVLIESADFDDPRLDMVRAQCLQRDGRLDEALTLLIRTRERSADADIDTRRMLSFALGQLHDRAGQPDAAFEAFTHGNELSLQAWRADHPQEDQFVPGLAGIGRSLQGMRPWRDVEGPTRDASPVFLFGFQRSGTTLLDTVLGSHERVHVMEELPVINRVIDHLSRHCGAYPDAVAGLSPAQLESLRQVYWREATALSGFDAAGGAMLLDKSPLHTVHLALLRRLFPQARLILALRHPYDVALSCFMQDFTMNDFMTHFTSVAGVAQVYRRVMDLWLQYRELVDPDYFEMRYERLVEDPEAQLRAVVDYLDLDWRDAFLDHGNAARARGLINTPSYQQVTEPIYQRARYRWKRYADHLAPAIEILRPYAERWDYES